MRNKTKLIVVYAFYLVVILGVIYLFLPANTKQNINKVFESKNNHPKAAVSAKITLPENENGKFIILTFDDSFASQYGAYEQLKKSNLKGTLYINSGLIGQKDRLTLDELTEMYNNGWDIGNHTVHHVDLTKVSSQKAYDEIHGCAAWLIGHGFTRNMGYKHFAYPYGAYNDNVVNILKKQGFLTARTTNAGSSTADLLELGRASLYGMTKKNISDFMYSDEKLIILNLHRIVPDNTKNMSDIDLEQSNFDELIKSIEGSQRQAITLTQWYALKDQLNSETTKK